MSNDYASIGFKCGLEVHQQLAGHKLFCSCGTQNSENKADARAQRKLRAVAGELGLIDPAVAHEMRKGKKFFYESSTEDTCLIDYDEEPPQAVNQEAVHTALQLCTLLKARIVDEIHFMRKTVIDGSNVTGFQRTALIGRNGTISTLRGDVRISTICLEEEAAKKIKETKKYIKYRLDRLGIPLIEIATAADIKDPEHARETAEKLGLLIRSLQGVKRGLGTIRQDVNISISGGARTEIKGFQDLRSIPKVIEHEIARQQQIIAQGKKIKNEVRKAEDDFTTSFLRPMPGAARLYPETDVIPFVPAQSVEVPKTLEEESKRLVHEHSIQEEVSLAIAKKGIVQFYEACVQEFPNITRSYIAECLISLPKEIRRKTGIDLDTISQDQWKRVFSLLNSETISKSVMGDVLTDIAQGTFSEEKYRSASDTQIENAIKEAIAANPGITMGALIGKIMRQFKGRADGKKVNELIRKHHTQHSGR